MPTKVKKKTFEVPVERTSTQHTTVRVKAYSPEEAQNLVEEMDLDDDGDWDVVLSPDLVGEAKEVKVKRKSR